MGMGSKRQNIYYNAIREHLNNFDARKWAPAAPYRNSRFADTGYTWTDLGPSDWPVRFGGIGNSYLPCRRLVRYLHPRNHPLVCHPEAQRIHQKCSYTHHFIRMPDISPEVAGPYWRYFGEDLEKAATGMLKERLRFFDRYLKGIKNGIDTEPPVFIYVMNGKKWRFENEWPLKRQVVAKYYFEGENSLSKSRKTDGSDKYKADFTHDSRYGANKATRWNAAGSPDEPMKRTDKDRQCLTYTSDPLETRH